MRFKFSLTTFWVLLAVFWLADSMAMLLSGAPFLSALLPLTYTYRLLFRLIMLALLTCLLLNSQISEAPMERPTRPKPQVRPRTVEELFRNTAATGEDFVRSGRLADLSLGMAQALQLSAWEQERLRVLCYCYDVALPFCKKAAAPMPSVQQPLVEDPWEKHIELGAGIVANIDGIMPVAELVRAHEECYNGHGYLGLSGDKIPLACRIFQVALMYDSLLHPQNGRRAFNQADALNELGYYAGTVLDPEIVELLRQQLRCGKQFAIAPRRVFSVE